MKKNRYKRILRYKRRIEKINNINGVLDYFGKKRTRSKKYSDIIKYFASKTQTKDIQRKLIEDFGFDHMQTSRILGSPLSIDKLYDADIDYPYIDMFLDDLDETIVDNLPE